MTTAKISSGSARDPLLPIDRLQMRCLSIPGSRPYRPKVNPLVPQCNRRLTRDKASSFFAFTHLYVCGWYIFALLFFSLSPALTSCNATHEIECKSLAERQLAQGVHLASRQQCRYFVPLALISYHPFGDRAFERGRQSLRDGLRFT